MTYGELTFEQQQALTPAQKRSIRDQTIAGVVADNAAFKKTPPRTTRLTRKEPEHVLLNVTTTVGYVWFGIYAVYQQPSVLPLLVAGGVILVLFLTRNIILFPIIDGIVNLIAATGCAFGHLFSKVVSSAKSLVSRINIPVKITITVENKK